MMHDALVQPKREAQRRLAEQCGSRDLSDYANYVHDLVQKMQRDHNIALRYSAPHPGDDEANPARAAS